MPAPSTRVSHITLAGNNGWAIHLEAVARIQAGEDVILLTVGDHDLPSPSETVDACIRELMAGHHRYTPFPGLPQLRAAMARTAAQCTGAHASPDEVIVTPGGQAALFASVHATLDAGDHAIVVAPYYATYPATLRSLGVDFTVVDSRPEDGFQPSIPAIREAITPQTRVLLINSPNNPTGAIYTRDSLEALAEICLEHDLWMISDEVYWSLAGDGQHLSPRAIEGMRERTLVINSLSKSHGMTGWRIGWITAPKQVVGLLTNLNMVTTYGLPDFISRAAIDALDRGYGVKEIANRYLRRQSKFTSAVKGLKSIANRSANGGMYVFLDVAAVEPDCTAFARKLLAAESVAVMPGASFGKSAAGHVRLCMCQPETVLEEAATRLVRFVENYSLA